VFILRLLACRQTDSSILIKRVRIVPFLLFASLGSKVENSFQASLADFGLLAYLLFVQMRNIYE
jgi:hypothetical protein